MREKQLPPDLEERILDFSASQTPSSTVPPGLYLQEPSSKSQQTQEKPLSKENEFVREPHHYQSCRLCTTTLAGQHANSHQGHPHHSNGHHPNCSISGSQQPHSHTSQAVNPASHYP